MKKYLEDLAYKACAGREMRTTLDQTPAWVLRDAELEKFAELVAAHTREAMAVRVWDALCDNGVSLAVRQCAQKAFEEGDPA
jgi:hypothetical protein